MERATEYSTWEAQELDFNPVYDTEAYERFDADCREFVSCVEKVAPKYRTLAKKQYLSKLADKWQGILSLTEGDILSHITATTNYSEESAPDYLSASDLLYNSSSSSSKLSWIIPDFLPSSGLYLLAAMPKAGKTVLTDFIKYAMLVSGEFLGRPVKQGKILDIQTEMSSPEIISNLEAIGFKDLEDDNMAASLKYGDKHRIKLSFNLATDLPWLDRELAKYKPSLVILDSLRSMARESGLSENTQEFGNLVYALQSIINKHAVCGVLIHHMKKPPDVKLKKGELPSLDIIAQSSGHTSITAGTSGVIGLMKLANGHRFLKAELRTPTTARVTYTLAKDIDTGISKLKVVEDTGHIIRPHTFRILRLLHTNLGTELTSTEIIRNVASEQEFGEASDCLSYLRDTGLINYRSIKAGKKRDTLYWMESKDEWLVGAGNGSDTSISKDLVLSSKLARCHTKSEIRELFASYSPHEISKACEGLLENEYKTFESALSQPEYKQGSVVRFKYEERELEGEITCITLPDAPSLNNTLYSVYMADGSDLEVKESDILCEVRNIIAVEYEPIEKTDVPVVDIQEDPVELDLI